MAANMSERVGREQRGRGRGLNHEKDWRVRALPLQIKAPHTERDTPPPTPSQSARTSGELWASA